MKVIIPDTIDLASTNVAADTYPIWHHGERYDIGDYVQYQGVTPHKVYKSLSSVANHITGSHVNGFRFFQLGKYGGQK